MQASRQRVAIDPPPPAILVIYGASGDLTERKLIPALHNLSRDGLMPERFAVIGTGRRALGDDALRRQLKKALRAQQEDAFEEASCDWLMERTSYIQGDLEDRDFYDRLRRRIAEARREHGIDGGEIHYLAVPPKLFADVVERLCAAGVISREPASSQRVVIEKPFGDDLDSARNLNRRLQGHLDERQIYRIDHYLGKETVQNLLVFRFGNAIFEPIWNRHYVDHVQITVAEDGGVGHRAEYYDQAGALRDMVPNHLMQLLSLIAMEPPISLQGEALRNAKAEALKAVVPWSPEEVAQEAVRGQYAASTARDGQHLAAYRAEEGVQYGSDTETFAALRLTLDNWRWADVPFYLRTGKRMATRQSEILMQFRHVPARLFQDTPVPALTPNRLLIRIQPREAIALQFEAKRPGPAIQVADAELEFCYRDYFGLAPVTGYETLLYDALRGEATLFQRADSIEEGWRIIDPVLAAWKAEPPGRLASYPAGTWGPEEADKLLARYGHAWRNEV